MEVANKPAILNQLRNRPDLVQPVRIDVVQARTLTASEGPDAVLEIAWSGRSWQFAAEFQRLGTPRLLQEAMGRARRSGERLGLRPLVVTPFLSTKQLDVLLAEQMSGFDLNGNAVLQVPGELLVYRKGEPNAYPASAPIRKIYQGTSSIVARAFLVNPRYDSVNQVLDEIKQRGASLSLSTVSKVLKALEDDLVIQRAGRSTWLIQPGELLESLATNYVRPKVTKAEQFRWRRPGSDIGRLVTDAGRQANTSVMMTGAASALQYAVMAREKTKQFYCKDLAALTNALDELIEPARRFADIELLETGEPQIYFDLRVESRMAVASPVQTWLELQAGDKREQETAEQVKQRILAELDKLPKGIAE